MAALTNTEFNVLNGLRDYYFPKWRENIETTKKDMDYQVDAQNGTVTEKNSNEQISVLDNLELLGWR